MKNSQSTGTQESIFIIKSANDWLDDAKSSPVPTSLFMDSWFEGELCILFAETNVGKSILAVQIGVEIAATQPVIYFDFELSAKQFEGRYSNNYTDHFIFPRNFKRAELDPDNVDYLSEGFKNIEEFIYSSMKKGIQDHEAKVLIIDNLTYLRTETEKAKEALPLMKHLKQLKNEFNLSILVLAHTPKRNMSAPISRNDLGGSRMLMNFCDSSFAIGESTLAKDIRYIKQIKTRATTMKYDSNNVAVFRLCKPRNFLKFISETNEHDKKMNIEQEHLKINAQQEKKYEKQRKIKSLLSQGKSYRQIAELLDISIGSISSYSKSSEFSSQNSVCSDRPLVQNVHDVQKTNSFQDSLFTKKPEINQNLEPLSGGRRFKFSNVKSATKASMPVNWRNE